MNRSYLHRTVRRRGGAVATVLAMLISGMTLAAVPAHANLAGSNFEANDGNLKIDFTGNNTTPSNMDWNGFAPVQWSTGTAPYRQSTTTVSGWAFHGFEDAQKSGSDTQFGGGTKQDANCPTVNTNTSPNKDDLVRVYLANKTINNHVFLALAWVRIKLNTTNSSTHIGFEFNQGHSPCPAASNSDGLVQRTPGDMLIVYDFAGGTSGTPDISLRRWVTSGACDIGSDSPPCWGVSTDLSALGFAEAKVNTFGSVTDALTPPNPPATASGSSTLDTDQFGEAAIDLTGAGVFPANGACAFFGQAEAVSRSSGNSGNAAMEDLVGPGPVSISNCATKTFNLTFANTSPPIAGTSVYAVYTTADGVQHQLQLTRSGNTYTASDGTIQPGSTLTGVRLEIRNADGSVAWKTSPDQTETINGDTTNSGTFSYTLALSPKKAENFINTSHTFTATVTGTGTFNNAQTVAPLVGVTVNWATFNGTPAGCGTLGSATSTTDGNGQAKDTITSATPCTTSIRAWINGASGTSGFDSGEVSDTGTKAFVDYRLTVSPPSATNALGTTHTFTITLEKDSGSGFAPYQTGASESVSFSIDDPNNTGAYIVSINGTATGNTTTTSGTCSTSAAGTCTIVTSALRAGTFTLNASFTATNDSGTESFDGSGRKTMVKITVSKNTCTTSAVAPGSLVTFTIPWSTSGGTLNFARIVDNLPPQMLFESATPAPSSAPAVGSSGTVAVPLANPLPSGSSGTVTIVVSIAPSAAAGTYTNSGNFVASNDTASDTTHSGIQVPFSASIKVGASAASASGEAYGVTASLAGNTLIPPTPDVTSGSAQLFALPANTTVNASLLSVSNQRALTATSAEDNASATVANVDVELSGLSVKADVVAARSDSRATGSTATTLTDGSEVLGLSINGTAIGDVSSPRVITIVNGLGLKIAEVDVLENTGASGAAIGGAGGAQPQGGLFNSGLTVNGLHVILVQAGTNAPLAEAIVSHAQSTAAFPTLNPCAVTGPYVVGEANVVHEVLTYPTGPTTALEGDVILPSTGGDVTSTINSLELGGVITSGTGSTETKGALSPLNAFSTATVQNLSIPGLSLTAVSSSATANGALSGTTTILKLVIGSTNVCQAIGGSINKICTPPANDVLIDISRTLKIVLNEQITDPSGKVITVNAVHIFVLGTGNPLGLPVGSDLTISQSIAGTS